MQFNYGTYSGTLITIWARLPSGDVPDETLEPALLEPATPTAADEASDPTVDSSVDVGSESESDAVTPPTEGSGKCPVFSSADHVQ